MDTPPLSKNFISNPEGPAVLGSMEADIPLVAVTPQAESLYQEKSSFLHEGIRLRYLEHEKTGVVGFEMVPLAKVPEIVSRPDRFKIDNGFDVTAWSLQPLVGLHLAEDPYPGMFSQGRTLQGSPSAQALAWHSQVERPCAGGREIVTRLRSRQHGLVVEHIVRLLDGIPAITCRAGLGNTGTKPLTLQMVTSFGLSGLTPFARDDAPGRLRLHRFRSSWSQEGRHVVDSLESLHLEPSWTRVDLPAERFGQAGSMPVRGFFPTAVLEDEGSGVFWGAQLAWLGSWQMELLRRGDTVALAGGLADFESGHWQKTLAPGESFETPAAFLTCGAESLEAVCEVLLDAQRFESRPSPPCEADLPIVFNEFCLSWGQPTEQSMRDIAARLKNSPIKYVVIDAGWSQKPEGYRDQGANGDWEISPGSFPTGFAQLNAELRAQGQIPGIWFEFEVTTEGSSAHLLTEHHLKRHQRVLSVGPRRFWDFRDPWVIDYLSQRVIEFLRREGFGYLKVDYNDTIGIGCDSPDGLGEGLRQHLVAVHRFFEKIRDDLPDLVIENCASGGHRLEPLMMGATAMSSFSDAHEGPEIPWIGANLHRLVPPEKSQIWAVLRPGDTHQRLYYTLSAGFLGRLCLSGEVAALSAAQWQIAEEAMALYRRTWPIIRHGSTRRFGLEDQNSQHLRGWQALRRVSTEGNRILVVWHAFANSSRDGFEVPLPPGAWKIQDQLNPDVAACVSHSALHIANAGSFSGGVAVLGL